MNCAKNQQRQLSQVTFLLSGVVLCTLYQLTISARLHEPLTMPQIGEDFGEDSTEGVVEPTAEHQGLEELFTTTHQLEPTDQAMPRMHVVHHMDTVSDFKASTESPAPPDEAPHNIKSKYPVDLFSIADRRRGWVILYIIGVMYMFFSVAIVCDEFFVPALRVITDELAISDDVTGATFMAAGRSAPGLFASVIGVFITHSDVGSVGIGSIVGSAVFSILFVIGMSALFSREVLHLTWWPLFRDVSFYILDLILLLIFFLDNVIMWWESLMLVTSYTLYVVFMKFNVQIEHLLKAQLYKITAVGGAGKEDAPVGMDGLRVCKDAEGDEDENDKDTNDSCKNGDKTVKKEEEDAPLSLKWPDTRRKQATYLFLLPIIFPLWLTVPDVRNEKSRKFFVVTFLGSILWITNLSYFISWWALRVGETIGVSWAAMGLTVAAGASMPDIITSVIVARRGLGDMVVSSSVGRNIFDITVGLPVLWLLYSVIHDFSPVAVSSSGLLCAVVLLFLMLFLAVISIASCKWKMNKVLGLTMVLLYFIFVVLSIMMQYRIFVCPLG